MAEPHKANTANSMTGPPPMFNFPKEKNHGFTAADLIAILKAYGDKPSIGTEYKLPEHPNTKEACMSAALDLLPHDPGHKRVVRHFWPRSPTGKEMPPRDQLPGKQTPNGIHTWGATLFDFYYVNRFPDIQAFITLATGSKILKWMKENDELDWAKAEIEWAEDEDDPKVIKPCSIRSIVEEQEDAIRQGKAGKSMPKIDNADVFKKLKSRDPIFHPSNYPSPWPLVPFSYPTERLQTLIPLHHLPKKIIVHDPWDLLTVPENIDQERDWTKMQDNIHVYNLRLSAAGSARSDETEGMIRKLSKKRELKTPDKNNETISDNDEADPLPGYLIGPSSNTVGPIPPPIYVFHDPPPRPPAPQSREDEEGLGYGPIEEAHLYISPAHRIGVGNHSIVYHGEWELPRSAVFPPVCTDPVLCKACVAADIERILVEVDGPNGERMESRWREKSAFLKLVSVIKRPVVTVNIVSRDAKEKEPRTVVTDPGEVESHVEFEGPVRPIRTTVKWQDPLHPTCEHLTPPPIVPPTVKVRVAAKLSIGHDDHLCTEADNYQKFDKHMFEHWSGLNVLPPVHDPIPIGPLVPQFYGYYVPEAESRVPPQDFSSPILLVEDCGNEVSVDDLTTDERNEAVSLIRRFHFANWIHGSVYSRNILSQYGPLDVPPAERLKAKDKRTLNFRLIDFGRSYKCVGKDDENGEEDQQCEDEKVRELFEVLY